MSQDILRDEAALVMLPREVAGTRNNLCLILKNVPASSNSIDYDSSI